MFYSCCSSFFTIHASGIQNEHRPYEETEIRNYANVVENYRMNEWNYGQIGKRNEKREKNEKNDKQQANGNLMGDVFEWLQKLSRSRWQ